MKKLLLVAAMALPLMPASAELAILKGSQEVQASGIIDFDTARGSLLDLTLGYGYFIADFIEVGARVSLLNDDDAVGYGLEGFAEYHIDNGTWMIPFFGGSIGYASIDDDFYGDDAGMALGFYGGANYFLSDNVALTGTLNVDVATADLYLSDDGLDSTDVSLRFGVRAFF